MPEIQNGNSSEQSFQINSEVMIELISSKAADIAVEKISHQEDRRRQNFLLILSLISLLGAGALYSGITLFIKSEVSQALTSDTTKEVVTKKVKESIESEVGEFKKKIEGDVSYQLIATLSLSLDIGTSFSNKERDGGLAILEEIKKSEVYKKRNDFITHLEKIVDSFTSAYSESSVDKVDELFRDLLITSKSASIDLVQHYGRGLLIVVTDEDIKAKKERFDIYAKAMRDKDYPEIGLFYKLLYTYKTERSKQSRPETEKLISALKFLDKKDKDIFNKLLTTMYEASNWQRNVNAMGREIEALSKSFYSSYEKKLKMNGISI